MPSPLMSAGAPPKNKQARFAPIYTGRFFTGLWTNRSPLRDAASTRMEEKFYGMRGDAFISGTNLETSNRSTVIRRPGNPIYDNTNTYGSAGTVLSFDEFRVNKAINDNFGSTLEQNYVMTDQTDQLFAANGLTRQSVFTKTATAGATPGQSHMKQVGNSLYFGNGLDNKKWLQSLFTRATAGNLQIVNTSSYPFMDTFLLDGTNVQQMLGCVMTHTLQVSGVAVPDPISISNVAIATNVVTLMVSARPFVDQPVGTQFMLWGLTGGAAFLNGAIITLTVIWSASSGSTAVGTLTNATHADYGAAADTGYLQILSGVNSGGSTTNQAKTGTPVPTWGATAPSSGNNFLGSLTLDGNILWLNRGIPTKNWGLAAPTTPLKVSVSGAAAAWAKSTYYSPASIYLDNTTGLWQVLTAGTTGATIPAWGAPTARQKVDVTNISIAANVVSVTTSAASPIFVAGDTVTLYGLEVATFLNGAVLTVLASGLTTTFFKANYTYTAGGGTYASAADYGVAGKRGTTVTDGTVVWENIQANVNPPFAWSSLTHYWEGDFIKVSAGGVLCYFQLRKQTQPFLNGNVSVDIFDPGGTNGQFDKFHSSYPAPSSTAVPNTLRWGGTIGQNTQYQAINTAGEVGASTDSGHYEGWEAAITTTVWIPAAGNYNFTVNHDDGAFFAFDNSTGAHKVAGSYNNPQGQQQTAKLGYGGPAAVDLAGSNGDSSSYGTSFSATWYFPAAGSYGLEIDYCNRTHASSLVMISAAQNLANKRDTSSSIPPAFPPFTTTGSSWNGSRIVFGATVQESSKQYTWSNVGPVSDYTWNASTPYTLAGTQIVDTNGNLQGSIETGVSGTTAPAFSTSLNSITNDQTPLKWINEGSIPIQTTTSKITAASAQGWLYWLALVNTLDNTVSNVGPVLSSGGGTNGGTGPVVSGQIIFAAGAGLDATTIDTQADYVAIFRSADGFSTPLLIASDANSFYTVPLTQYMREGYVDTTPDTDLDDQVQGANAGENTPPAPGAQNLTYHLNRLWYSIGTTVYYTTGPDAPVGNGVNGTAPDNFDVMPSQVTRLVPTAAGVFVFTISDVYVIPNNGGTIFPGLPYLQGIGLGNYNGLDINGSIMGFFTTDNQFVIMQPGAGVDYIGVPLGNVFRQNNSLAGTAWNTSTVYVSWHVSGEDAGWFVGDAVNGWYRLIQTPVPDVGTPWSPFATIVNGVRALKSVETAPGVHRLMLGPTGSGKLRYRSLTATTDGGTTDSNGTQYSAYGVLGSYVLAHPGQVAEVAFITTDSVNTGSPLIIGVLIDEAQPYYTGSFDMIRNWESDPPGLPQSSSILGQRFYLSDMPDTAAACRHMQILIQWPAEAAANELQSFTIFGSILAEQ